ncbi:hypothetical protein ACJIZ3_010750 [Penstemon smallii]|uniref:Vacuolar protein sorting-associated protein Ist1 n=1 Tax=Penstemon smallii TaxID=265156 RepID=A0ABD3ULB3_9LAMI
MFDILFGWRKASKCKKLIRRVQCRLKLLKNKRVCIVKQLRTDVAELLKRGHDQSAFERVEQLVKDESMIETYELLGDFCEFIIINLPYIRKNKDCPNDINEAISTLIFSSARFGDIPELLSVRKLFGERYGQTFVTSALELLPRNLVNTQIKEKLYIKNVPDDVKYKLLDWIARHCIDAGPMLLEYEPCFEQYKANKSSSSSEISTTDVRSNNHNGALELQVSNTTEVEGKIVSFDRASDITKNEQTFPTRGVGIISDDSSSETSVQMPEEMIYLDDIEELVSPINKDGILQDQRLFMFKSSGINSQIKNSLSRSSRKMSKRKRLRRSVNDVECAMYYGESNEASPDNKHGSNYRNLQRNKIEFGSHLCQYSYRDEGEDNETHSLRAKSMPIERPNESNADNIYRSKSFPFGQPRTCGHIHPKLPDYDELAAKFMTLKRVTSEIEQEVSNGNI